MILTLIKYSGLLFTCCHIHSRFCVMSRRSNDRMRKNLCQRLSYFKGCIHCSSYIGYRSTHFYACTGTKTITLNILNFYIGCFGSSVKCYEAGSKTVKFKDTTAQPYNSQPNTSSIIYIEYDFIHFYINIIIPFFRLKYKKKIMIFCGFYLWFFVGLNITMIATILPELKEKKVV